MKLQEALDFMGWEKLPKPEKSSGNRCPVLVKRTTGEKNYAISNDFRIIADINFRASIAEIIEYYPLHREDKKEIAPVEKTNREKMIEFLLSHNNKLEVVKKKRDKELIALCKLYGGNFD